MKTCPLAVACLAVIALAAPAAQKDDKKPKAPVYKTPQEVFDAAQKAEAEGDFETLVGCYTPRAQGEYVFLLAGLFGGGWRIDDDKQEPKEYTNRARTDGDPAP